MEDAKTKHFVTDQKCVKVVAVELEGKRPLGKIRRRWHDIKLYDIFIAVSVFN
jgi:hypothetical protein